jgi:hypothetical protein
MKLFCKHEWKVLSETITKSKFEVATEKLLEKISKGEATIPRQLADANRKHIQIFTCGKCGKLKRFVENI